MRRSAKSSVTKSPSHHHSGGHLPVIPQSVKTPAKNGLAGVETPNAFKNSDDAMAFFILSDCVYSGRPKTRIEKVRTNVFKNSKLVRPTASYADLEYFELLMEPGAIEELKRRMQEMINGDEVSWDEIKAKL